MRFIKTVIGKKYATFDIFSRIIRTWETVDNSSVLSYRAFAFGVETKGDLPEYDKINMKALMSKYQKEGDDVTIMTELFGYDEKTIEQTMAQEYQNQLNNIDPTMPKEDRAKLLQSIWKEHNLNKSYPWIKTGDFKKTYDKYKDDPTKLMESLNNMKPNIPASYSTDPDMVMQQTGINKELLNQNVVELANNSKEVLQQEFKDYYKDMREEQLASFKDNAKVQEMFRELNPEKSWLKEGAGIAKDALTLFTSRKGGWYDKEGNYLGAIASPDFEDYVRDNPDSGFKYVPEKTNDVIDFLWEGGGAAISMMYGIDPAAAIDAMAGHTKDTNKDGVVDSKDEYNTEQDDEIINPMAFMGMGDSGKSDKGKKGSKGGKGGKKGRK
jgi:hypothetical protein